MGCLNEETIVAFIGARLPPDDVARVEEHTGSCSSCHHLLLVAIRAAGDSRVTDPMARGSTDAIFGRAVPSKEDALARGSSFGRYIVLEPLGRGGMGEVYAAYDPELDRKVALKILHARGDTPDGRNRSRLLREAKAIAKLRHPNVVVVHDAGTIGDRVFLAMEHVDGQTLAAWLAERTHTRTEILDVFMAAGRGLGAAHAAGLVHRDFKPQNVMVEKDGGVRVMDFGLAREIGARDSEPAPENAEIEVGDSPSRNDQPDTPLTLTGELVGTPRYMAPEQFRTQRADARTDQFNFCVALYQALYGAHPFGGGQLAELMKAVIAGRVQPAPPKSSVPVWLRRILLRGLAVDPAARWESMAALTVALARDPASQRRRWLGAGVLAAAMLAGIIAVRAPRTTESMCRGGSTRLAGVWEPPSGMASSGARRAITRAAFEQFGGADAVDSWDRAARVLDRYAADWLRMYEDTCLATNVRGEQSAEVLDLRMDCLRERLGRVKALTDLFVRPNASVIENAVGAASSLATLDRCADVNLLHAVMPPPDEPKARARLESLRFDLARVRALGASGECAASMTAGHKLVADAEALGYLPFLADSLIATFRSPGCVHDDFAQHAKRALLIGLTSHHHEAAAEAALSLAQLTAGRTADIGRAREWIDVGGAVMQGMSGSHPLLDAWWLQALAVVQTREGDHRTARQTLERAAALIEKTQGPDHLDYANIHNTLGWFLVETERYEEALSYYERAARLTAAASGPEHSMLGMINFNIAEVLNHLHRYDEARTAAEHALTIWRRRGASAYFRGCALTMLGDAMVGQGHAHEAAAQIGEAIRLYGNDTSSEYPLAARFVLARALWASPAERPRALSVALEAKAGYQRLPNKTTAVVEIDAWLKENGEGKRRRPN